MNPSASYPLRRPMTSCLLLLGGLLAVPPASAATVYVSSLGSPNTSNVTRGASQFIGTKFTTDASGASFTLASVDVALQFASGITDFFVKINAESGLNKPGTLIGTLSGPVSPEGNATLTYTATGITLNASTSYWVTMGFTSGAGEFTVPLTDQPASATGPWTLNAWATTFAGNWNNAGSSSVPLLAIQATAVPEPSVAAALCAAGALGLATRRRARRLGVC